MSRFRILQKGIASQAESAMMSFVRLSYPESRERKGCQSVTPLVLLGDIAQ